MENADPAQFSLQLHRYALDCLARREYCRSELQRRLAARGAGPAAVEKLLDALESAGQLDETRYAEAFVHARVRRGYGPARIRSELRSRGLAAERIDAALSAADCDWREQAREARRKKFGAAAPADFKERLRQMRHLEYRGFDRELIDAAFDGRG